MRSSFPASLNSQATETAVEIRKNLFSTDLPYQFEHLISKSAVLIEMKLVAYRVFQVRRPFTSPAAFPEYNSGPPDKYRTPNPRCLINS